MLPQICANYLSSPSFSIVIVILFTECLLLIGVRINGNKQVIIASILEGNWDGKQKSWFAFFSKKNRLMLLFSSVPKAYVFVRVKGCPLSHCVVATHSYIQIRKEKKTNLDAAIPCIACGGKPGRTY